MRMPGFAADASLYVSRHVYAGGTTHLAAQSGVVPAISASSTGFVICMEFLMFDLGMSWMDAWMQCSRTWGLLTAVEYAGYVGASGPAAAGDAALVGGGAAATGTATTAGGGFLAAEGFGLTGTAAVALPIALWAVAIGIAAHDIPAALGGPKPQPPSRPAGCTGGRFVPPSNITGWSVPILYPGCAGAWDHAQVNAQAVCDAKLTCGGTCPNGTPCKPVAILADRVSEKGYLLTCRAEGRYVCECGCQ
jgi:hypothetical protein